MLGDEAVYPIDLLFSKPPDTEHTVHAYTQLLDKKFQEAHMCARETLGAEQQTQKDNCFKRTYGKPYQKDDKGQLQNLFQDDQKEQSDCAL